MSDVVVKSVEEPATKTVAAKLSRPLDPTRVARRKAPGGGREEVPYLEGHDVITVANEIFDFQWSSTVGQPTIHTWERPAMAWDNTAGRKMPVMNADGQPVMEQTGVVYVQATVTALVDGVWVNHGDTGVAIIVGGSPESMEMALKGAATDALKRAFRQFGEQFGNSLYDKEAREELGAQAAAANKAKAAQPTPAQKAPPKPTAQGEADAKRQRALAYVVPAGQPMAGKTLAEVLAAGKMGEDLLAYLAGTRPNPAGLVFQPANTDEEKLVGAVKFILNHNNG